MVFDVHYLSTLAIIKCFVSLMRNIYFGRSSSLYIKNKCLSQRQTLKIITAIFMTQKL